MWSDLSQRQTEFPLGFKVSRHRDILKPNWSIRRNNPNGWRREEQSWNQQTHELLSANGTRESNQRTMEMKTFDLSMNNWKQSDWSGMSRCVRSSVDCFQRNFNYFPLSSLINRANTRLKNVRTVDGKILIYNRKLMWKIRKINWKTFTPVLFPLNDSASQLPNIASRIDFIQVQVRYYVRSFNPVCRKNVSCIIATFAIASRVDPRFSSQFCASLNHLKCTPDESNFIAFRKPNEEKIFLRPRECRAVASFSLFIWRAITSN